MNKPIPNHGTLILTIDNRVGIYYGLDRICGQFNFWLLDLGSGKTVKMSEWECDILDTDTFEPFEDWEEID